MSLIKPHIAAISLFPDMFNALHAGIPGRALEQGLLTLSHINLRDHATPPHYRVDDRPYGGGPGMVMSYEPMAKAIDAAKAILPKNSPVIHLSPQGAPLTQSKVIELAKLPGLILATSRYEGLDARLHETHIDYELSVGDFVLSGGELPAMSLIDAIIRCLPGALGDSQSAEEDSFSNGLLDYSHYTRPAQIGDLGVPKVLLSGDHEAIAQWRLKESLKKTWQTRPDLIKRHSFNQNEQALLDAIIQTKPNDFHQ